MAKNTIANSITAPNLDTANFQNAIYSASPATTQYNVSDTLNAPPASPIDGETYLVGTSPTGAYAGKANNIAVYATATSTWSFIAPSTSVAVIFTGGTNVGKIATWSGTAWVVQVPQSDGFFVGFVKEFLGNVPAGWADITNNRVTLSKVTYSALWNYAVGSMNTTTSDNINTKGRYIDVPATNSFQTPVLGGFFLKGGSAGQTVGTYIPDSIASHSHSIRSEYGNVVYLGEVDGYMFNHPYPDGETLRNTNAFGGAETVPKHIITKIGIKII